ncbi:MAG: AbiV family abortive infection protein [Nocardioidaceae bacterium]
MGPEKDQLLGLVRALLANARALSSDARLLFDHERYARSYALAALAGEELGKVEFCLDWLLGTPTLTAKEFRRNWQHHAEKLAGLTAYRAAFLDEPEAVSADRLRTQTQSVARRKMEAIYVDYSESGILTPQSIGADEANELLQDVEAAVDHASAVLDPLTAEVVAATNIVAPIILRPLVEHLAELTSQEAVGTLRELVTRAPSISSAEWEAAINEGTVGTLLGVDCDPIRSTTFAHSLPTDGSGQ